MHYMILNYTPPSDYADAEAVAAAAEGALWGAYTRALIDAGVFVSGNALHPSYTATNLRVRGEGRDIQDGPYAPARSSSAATTSSTCPTSTPPCTGRRSIRRPRRELSRCGPW